MVEVSTVRTNETHCEESPHRIGANRKFGIFVTVFTRFLNEFHDDSVPFHIQGRLEQM